MAVFRPIEKFSSSYQSKYYEKIISELSDAVSRGDLKPGDILPSERELAELFETSRVPVREALKILEFLGLVRQVPGEGMVIQSIEVSSLLSKVFFGMSISDDTADQLMDIRCLIEPYAASQAAELATEADLELIRQSLHEEKTLPARDRSVDFHFAIVHASHNKLLEEIYKFLSAVLLQFRAENLEERYESGPLLFHARIYHAIESHDGIIAQHLMRAHLEEEKSLSRQRHKASANAI